MEVQEQQHREEFKVGDAVSWNYGAGKARGHVMEVLTGDRKLGSRTFKATAEEPKYLLKIDKTGKEAIRKGETLERVDESAAAAAPPAAPPAAPAAAAPPKEKKRAAKSKKNEEKDEEEDEEEEKGEED